MRQIVQTVLLGFGFAGVLISLFMPSVCLFYMPCTINAGTQLGAGFAGMVGGAALGAWAIRKWASH